MPSFDNILQITSEFFDFLDFDYKVRKKYYFLWVNIPFQNSSFHDQITDQIGYFEVCKNFTGIVKEKIYELKLMRKNNSRHSKKGKKIFKKMVTIVTVKSMVWHKICDSLGKIGVNIFQQNCNSFVSDILRYDCGNLKFEKVIHARRTRRREG